MSHLAAHCAGLLCYLVALAGSGLFGLYVLAAGLDLWPRTPLVSFPSPWLVDLGWLTLFGVQHSGMARASFKRLWTRLVPSWLERCLYATLSGVLVALVPLAWQPLPGEPLWRLPLPLVIVPLAAGLGLVLVNLGHDHAGVFGLRQAWRPGDEEPPERLIVTGPYRWVRHPLMLCLLVFLWAQPVMRPEQALLAGGLSLYVVLGVVLEERDLARRFHPAYDEYRCRVPALFPWRWPAR